MTSLHAENDEPLIPMPAQRLPELRRAVAIVAPDSLEEFFEEMQQAFTEASERDSVTPIRSFQHAWSLKIALERRPERARRLHAAERAMSSHDDAVRKAAIREIGEIVRTTAREVKEGGSG